MGIEAGWVGCTPEEYNGTSYYEDEYEEYEEDYEDEEEGE